MLLKQIHLQQDSVIRVGKIHYFKITNISVGRELSRPVTDAMKMSVCRKSMHSRDHVNIFANLLFSAASFDEELRPGSSTSFNFLLLFLTG